MSSATQRYGPWLIAALAAGAGIAIWARMAMRPAIAPRPTPIPIVATQPQTAPTSSPEIPLPPQRYVDVIRLHNPDYPATEPWTFPVDLQEAAHIFLREPVYVCPRGDLWITRTDAPETSDVIHHAGDEQTHVVRETVVFVHWTVDRHGQFQPALICARDGGFDLVTETNRRPLPGNRAYHWDRASSWDQKIIVPTDTGISILNVGEDLTEDYHDLPAAPAPASQPIERMPTPQYLFDLRGLLAWIPADNGWNGSTRVARYLDNKWSDLDSSAGWSGPIIHLVPLLDGSVLVIRRSQGDSGPLTLLTLDTPAVDEARITQLVSQLTDDDPDKRKAAYDELTRYGPGAFPILTKLQNDPSPEIQARIEQLLSSRLTPRLGGISLNGEELKVVSRLRDGGVVLYAPDGVTITREGNQPTVDTPATLVIRPGMATQEAPDALGKDFNPDTMRISAFNDEWVLTDLDHGPQRYIPPGQLWPLLKKNERAYGDLFAIDSRGRWLFRKPRIGSSTRPSTGSASGSDTLIIDPTLPDPVPRLAVWWIDTGQPAGWDRDNWPAITRGKDRWALHESEWQVIDKNVSSITPPYPTITIHSPTTGPTTLPTTEAASRPAEMAPAGQVLLIDEDGNRYYDGHSTLTVMSTTGTKTTWPLPANSTGDGDVWLIRSPDGLLFLFNSPGRVVRIRPTPEKKQPFKVEAIFTRGIPDAEHPTRIWLDPAGRIDMVYDEKRLAIIFPTGQVPPRVADKILEQDLKLSDE